MKHMWNSSLVDRAQFNSCEVENVLLQDFKELYEREVELTRGTEDDIIMD